ncbi:MAG: hypothetical protein COA36_07710 [Desulfotalea sp.]|nr:MAG: hypothetical protein COA36_07710 [Desulfotalea sp.]
MSENEKMVPAETAAILGYFVESFYRVFKIGIYYPVGHVVLDSAASKCIQQLREISAGATSVRISIDAKGLFVAGNIITTTVRSAKELHQLFYNVGIVAVNIDRTVTHRELLQLIRKILSWRMELEGAKAIISFNLAELPESIQVEQQNFIVDQGSVADDEPKKTGQQVLDEICSSLTTQGLTGKQVDQCRDLLLTLSRKSASKHLEIKGFPNATWDDVQAMLYQIVTETYSKETGKFRSIAKSDINVILAIFQSLERGVIDSKAKETIEFLMSHLAGRKDFEDDSRGKENRSLRKKMRQKFDADKIKISDLKKFVYENNIPITILGQLTAADRSDQLSMYLQLIASCKHEELREDYLQKLLLIIVTDLTEREKDVLVEGIKHLIENGSAELFYHVFSYVIETLRGSQTGRSLDLIADFWVKMSHSSHMLLWPFIVNELLVVGMEEKRESFFEVLEIASHMYSDAMKSLKPQLEKMDGFNKTPIAKICFRSSYIYSYRLYAFLFETSLGDQLAVKVLGAFRKEPQCKLMEAVAPLLELKKEHHLEFLYNYLLQSHQKESPLSLRMAGGEIILEYLQGISEEQKNSEFLETTILATSSFYTKGIKNMLEQIIKTKKNIIIPLWPRKCRKAAKRAIKSLKRVSVSELF